jgi:bacterioferritin-associated ferredoxin
MYICVCKAITEDNLKQEMDKGVSPKDLESKLCKNADCGTCLIFAKEKIQEIYNQIQARTSKSS